MAGEFSLRAHTADVAVEAREIKAVTYSEMEIAETDGGWRIYVVFDV